MTKRTKNIIFFAVVLPVVFIVSSVNFFLKHRLKSETMPFQNAQGVVGTNLWEYDGELVKSSHCWLVSDATVIFCERCTNWVSNSRMMYCTNISVYEASNGPVVEFSVKSEGAFKNEPIVTQSNGTWLVVFRKGL